MSPAATSSGSPPMRDELFAFAKIPVGDFEQRLAFIEARPELDLPAAAERMLSQALKTFERLVKNGDSGNGSNSGSSNSNHKNNNSIAQGGRSVFEKDEEREGKEKDRDTLDAYQARIVWRFANQCVCAYALLDYGRDCGREHLLRYLHNLVLTPERYRDEYLERVFRLAPVDRLDLIRRPVPGYLEPLRLFCVLFDHLYAKFERAARARTEQTFLERVQTKLEAHLTRTKSETSPGEMVWEREGEGEQVVGRAI